MKINNILYIILLSINLFALTQCSEDPQEKVYKIGLSQCANDTYWRKEMNRHMLASSIQRKNMELIITDGNSSNIKQIRDIDSLVRIGIDLLIVSPNEADSLTQVITEVYQDIPVIMIDRKTSNDQYTTFIGCDNLEIGGLAGKYVGIHGKHNAKILELYGQIGASATFERSQSFNDMIDSMYSDKEFQHIGNLFCQWNRNIAKKRVSEFISSNQLPDIIYSHNDDMALGAYDALNEAGINTDDIIIIGVDGVCGDSCGIKGVIDGKLTATYLYSDGSEEVLETAEKILAGLPVEKNRILHTVQIDANNAQALYGQMSMTQLQDERIIKQGGTIRDQEGVIFYQKSINIILAILLAIGAAMFLYILKLVRDKQKAYQILNEKNAEINAQKEELEAQAAHLNETNTALERSKEKTLGSIRYAHTIQTAALPTEADLNYYLNAFVVYHPKDIVSGDFYWYHRDVDTDKEVHIIGVIDCTGHGVPGAFMSLIGVNLLDQIVKQRKIYSPAMILDELNKSVRNALRQEETENNDGMEAVICKIEKHQTGKIELTYEGAKFPLYHYIKSENKIETYKSSRRQVGGKFRNIEAMVKFEDHTMEIHEGDRLYMSSDGIGDQNNIDRKRYTNVRLVEKLQESSTMNMSDQRNFIWEDAEGFMFGCEQRDDITVLGIEI
ncbi:MAG: substrate-binding domain-containing protein [Bacteroidales bacterium]|nr:substrate-binding domain-containing protein [Bacteroidales bacterium]